MEYRNFQSLYLLELTMQTSSNLAWETGKVLWMSLPMQKNTSPAFKMNSKYSERENLSKMSWWKDKNMEESIS